MIWCCTVLQNRVVRHEIICNTRFGVARCTVLQNGACNTGKLMVAGVSAFWSWCCTVLQALSFATRAKSLIYKHIWCCICCTPIGGERVETPPHKWKPVRHYICRILGLTLVDQNQYQLIRGQADGFNQKVYLESHLGVQFLYTGDNRHI